MVDGGDNIILSDWKCVSGIIHLVSNWHTTLRHLSREGLSIIDYVLLLHRSVMRE